MDKEEDEFLLNLDHLKVIKSKKRMREAEVEKIRKKIRKLDDKINKINSYMKEKCQHKLTEEIYWDGHRNNSTYVCNICSLSLIYSEKFPIIHTVYIN